MVEIIAFAPTAFYHCTHCEVVWKEAGISDHFHQEQMENSLPADLAREYHSLSDWVKNIFRQHCDQVLVKVIDAASVEGFFKTLRYRLRKYPAIIIDRQIRFPYNQLEAAAQEIQRRLMPEP